MSATPPQPPGRPPGPPPPMPPPGQPADPTPPPPPPPPPAVPEPATDSPAAVQPPPPPPEPAPPEPSAPAPAPPAAPREDRQRKRRAWLIGAGVVAIVAIVAVVIALVAGGGDGGDDTSSGTVDQGRECDVFDGVLEPSDVASVLGITITGSRSGITDCEFGSESDFGDGGIAPITAELERGDAELFAGFRENYEEEDGKVEDVSELGDEAFYYDTSYQQLTARRGDLILELDYFGGDGGPETRDKLVALTTLVFDRLPTDVTLAGE